MMVSSERALTACPLRLNSTSVGSRSSMAVTKGSPSLMSVQSGVVMRLGLLRLVARKHAIDLGLRLDPLLHDVSRIEVLALGAVIGLDRDHVVTIFRGPRDFPAPARRGRDSAARCVKPGMEPVALLIDIFRIRVLECEKPPLHVVSGALAFVDLLLWFHWAISRDSSDPCLRPVHERSHEENASPRSGSDWAQPGRGRRSKRRPWFAITVPAARCPRSAVATNRPPFPSRLCTVCIGHRIRRRKTPSWRGRRRALGRAAIERSTPPSR